MKPPVLKVIKQKTQLDEYIPKSSQKCVFCPGDRKCPDCLWPK